MSATRLPDHATEPEAYTRALLDMLDGRDALEVQSELDSRLRVAVAGLDAEALRTPEAEGRWSIIEVLGHLVDTEFVYGYRMRKIVSEPGAPIVGYDPDEWTAMQCHREGDAAVFLTSIEELRRANLVWLRGLDDEQLDRAGIHSERGEESVRRIAELIAAHDMIHLRQVERIRTAVAGG